MITARWARIFSIIVLSSAGFMAVLCHASAAQESAAQTEQTAKDKIVVKRSFKAGTNDYYRLHIATKMNGPQTGNADAETVLDLTYRETVKDIAENGQVTLEQEFLKAKGTNEGGTQDLISQLPRLIIKRDAKGHVDIISDGGAAAYSALIVSTMKQLLHGQAALYPKASVKVGDTWKPDNILLITDNGTAVKETVKFDGLESKIAPNSIRLKATSDISSGPPQDTHMKSELTAIVSAEDGKVFKLTSAGEGTALGGSLHTNVLLETITEAQSKEGDAKPADAPK